MIAEHCEGLTVGQTAPPRWRKLAGSGAICGLSHEAARADLSRSAVCLDPGDITIDEQLQEFSRVVVDDLACFVDRRGIVLDEHFQNRTKNRRVQSKRGQRLRELPVGRVATQAATVTAI